VSDFRKGEFFKKGGKSDASDETGGKPKGKALGGEEETLLKKKRLRWESSCYWGKAQASPAGGCRWTKVEGKGGGREGSIYFPSGRSVVNRNLYSMHKGGGWNRNRKGFSEGKVLWLCERKKPEGVKGERQHRREGGLSRLWG